MFVYFSEMMNYIIGSVGPKFNPVVSKELKEIQITIQYFRTSDVSDNGCCNNDH